MKRLWRAAGMLAVCALFSCWKRAFPREGLTLGGRHVSYATLRDGRSAYGIYCRGCHGDRGDGQGPSALGLRPAPRDFRRGSIKFASVPNGSLPTDADLMRAVRNGVRGTAMLAWDVPNEELDTIVQYIKTFSPRWRTERAGVPIPVSEDVWGGSSDTAIARGEALYHGVAQCWSCHPAYVSRERVLELNPHTTVRPAADLQEPVAQTNDEGWRVLPPDFRTSVMKTGTSAGDVYRVLTCGVGGTEMRGLSGRLADADIWALVHYVRTVLCTSPVR